MIAKTTPDEYGFLEGGGEMGHLIRNLDWSRTSVGPIENWPQSLRTAVNLCLHSRFPIVLWFGPELVMVYNDAYVPILGEKHPASLGARGQEVWPEIWPIIGPMFESVLEQGQATWSDDLQLLIDRHGFTEECYFTFSYSPIFDDALGVVGVFTAVTETTRQVIGARQLLKLRDLSENIADRNTELEVYARVGMVLEKYTRDFPFTAMYQLSEDGKTARLVGWTGLQAESPAAPVSIDLTAKASAWPISKVLATHEPVVMSALTEHFGPLPSGAWDLPPRQAFLLPIAAGSKQQPYAVLIVGLNPHRIFDDTYRSFLETIADRIAKEISNARAFEEERTRAETLAELDRAKTLFFNNISHELRTPLTLMLGPLDDLLAEQDARLSPAQRDNASIARRNAKRLLKLVNSLLDFSRLEAGRIQAAYQPTDLAALTRDLASGFRSAIERAGIQFNVDCPPLAEPVYVDREMWEKILSNLLSNAFKFTYAGEITVRLKAEGRMVQLSVIDTGIGIKPEDQLRIFERFYRGDEGRTFEGSGIGLSLVKELIKLHGGTIGVESTYGKCCTFLVSLPLGKAHLPADKIVEGPETPPQQSGIAEAQVQEMLRWHHGTTTGEMPAEPGASQTRTPDKNRRQKPHLLIADDNADMRDYLQRLLHPHYRLTLVGDGQAALAAIRRQLPDLVLTDVMMPFLDGFGLLDAMRNKPETQPIPVVMLSARAGEEARVEGVEAGADAYLVKPFSAPELLATIKTHLELGQMRRESAEKLELQRRNLYQLFQHSPAAVLILKGREGICEMINPIAASFWGGRDVLGKPMLEAWPNMQKASLEFVQMVFDTGEPFYANEYPVFSDPKGDGHVVTRYMNSAYIPYRGTDGSVEGVMLFSMEVTDQVQGRQAAEEVAAKLEEQRKEFYNVFMQTPYPMAVFRGPDLFCEFANKQAGLVWLNRNIEGKTLYESMPEIIGQGPIETVERVLQTGESIYQNEVPLRSDWNADGQPFLRYYTLVYSPYHNPITETVEKVICSAFNVTEQVLARQALEQVAKNGFT